MHCYYQGTLQVTGGNINDVERTAMAYIGKWIYVEGSQEKSGTLIVDFSDASTVYEDDVRGFVAEAEKCGWNINGTLSYYGDYEGFMVITDNVIEEISSEEMAIRKYLDTPSVKAEKEFANKAVSMAAYLFLRFVFAKEDFSQTVIEDLEWIAEELITNNPSDLLVRNMKYELREGSYGNRMDIVSNRLAEYFGFDETECEEVANKLLHWMSADIEEDKERCEHLSAADDHPETKNEKLYLYLAYDDTQDFEKVESVVFLRKEDAITLLKQQVEDRFECKWDDVLKKADFAEDDIFREDFVSRFTPDAFLYWMVRELEIR